MQEEGLNCNRAQVHLQAVELARGSTGQRSKASSRTDRDILVERKKIQLAGLRSEGTLACSKTRKDASVWARSIGIRKCSYRPRNPEEFKEIKK